VEGSFERHRYVVIDAMPYTVRSSGLSIGYCLRIVMCFCNEELLVGPHMRHGISVTIILAANGKSGCVGPIICSLVAFFFLSQMMFRAGDPRCSRILILNCYLIVEAGQACVDQVSLCQLAAAECVLRASPGWRIVLQAQTLSSWTVVGPPSSRAENCSLQGRGFIIFCVALAHWVYLLTCSAICGIECVLFRSQVGLILTYANLR
jgi:hypothetical protein